MIVTTTSSTTTIGGAARDDAWLRRLIDEHATLLHRIAAAQVGPDDADDMVSETFAKAWHERERFDPSIAGERAWLAGILLNRCRMGRRARRRWELRQHELASAAIESSPDFTGSAHARLDAGRRHQAVLSALRCLPVAPRTVLVLVAYGGLDPHEVAIALDMPPGTVRNHLHRARRAVSERLDAEGHS